MTALALACAGFSIWLWLRVRETWLLVCAFGFAVIGARMAGAW